ncbi:Uncharacterized SAM-binding protein YcdF, DUF218 family [Kandleria vitulina]|uniref:YdcF family protein n=1 Tax=Kandleria vitulina TaxID=1630 RepID=UPI0008853A7C|nr:YdcF family protein [Kandleria vitulina]SDL58271.1 Uncharacterized SAM-binding protein YcdF, DUF218 family [Kandleria vitulina]
MLYAGIILLLVFVVPIFVKKVFHLGSVLGIVIALSLIFSSYTRIILYALFNSPVQSFIKIMLVLLIALFIIETYMMIIYALKKPGNDGLLIVLGCKKGSDTLNNRIKKAYAYLADHPQSLAIVSGGVDSHDNVSEAEYMKEQLVKMGIDEERIYEETRSEDTKENIRYSLELIDKHQLVGPFILVTSGFHIYRARLIALREGMVVSSLASRTPLLLLPGYYLRELLALSAHMIFK